jgi:outer membrane protein assembly factor BamA
MRASAFTQELMIDTQRLDIDATIAAAFPEPFYVEQVTFTTDVYFESAEFQYLTGLEDGMLVSCAELKKAVFYLCKKKKFSSITLKVSQGKAGKRLHIELVGVWTFAALKFHGMMLGKDAYRQYYLLEPGDPFDEVKHQHSLDAMAEHFAQEGYHGCVIANRLERDEITKSIIVHVTLKQGARFTVGDVQFTVAGEFTEVAQQDLYQQLDVLFFKKIAKNNSTKEMLNTQMKLLKRYLAKCGFLQVTIELQEVIDYEEHKVNLSFTCNLHRKKELHFEGNQFFSSDQLLDALLLFGQSAWMLPASMICQEIEQLYRKKGFWSVVVDATEQDNELFFSIREGGRASIKKVSLRRVVHNDAQQLVKNHCAALIKNKGFDEEAIARAVDGIMHTYISKGFLDAHLLKQDFVAYEGVANVYELVLTLHEGDCCCVSGIEFDRFQEFEDQGPFLAFKQCKEPVPLSMDFLQEQRLWLVATLKKMGYPYVQVKPECNRTGASMVVRWVINVGEAKAYFGKTVVTGSTTFPFAYILRELRYQEGDLLDQTALKKTMLRFKELEIFDTVHLYPYDAVQPDGDQPILLKLQQDDAYELRMRAGLAVQQVTKDLGNAGLTYRVGGSFLIKNPFNAADQIRVETNVARSERTFFLQYQRPWIFDYPLRTLVQGYSNSYLYPGLCGGTRNLYEVGQQGFVVGLLRKYAYLDAEVNMGIELMKTSIGKSIAGSALFARELARAINFEPQLLNQKVPYVLIEPTLLIDFLDNRLQPGIGSFTLLTMKGMFPFGPVGQNSYFVRASVEQSFFVPLWRKLIGAFRLRFGHIFHRTLRDIMPPERFYLGGANSIRSYENDRCPPLGVFIDQQGTAQLVPQGGKSMANLNLELRFPLFKQVGGALFQDFGALSGENVFNEIRARSVLAATGFGIRYNTPIGPLRFDIAWKWKRNYPEENMYCWFLTFGNAF